MRLALLVLQTAFSYNRINMTLKCSNYPHSKNVLSGIVPYLNAGGPRRERRIASRLLTIGKAKHPLNICYFLMHDYLKLGDGQVFGFSPDTESVRLAPGVSFWRTIANVLA
jgi:hypothetical protein